ncbi:hypothetical protein QYZ88_013105 [Lachnospiraceae bacterium C1.1]|nr:hypothetical protein [Lachnospiraceae bacterium C1.1]
MKDNSRLTRSILSESSLDILGCQTAEPSDEAVSRSELRNFVISISPTVLTDLL